MNDSDARLRFFVDCYKLREATTVVEVGCNFKDVRWCIRNKHLFLLDNLRKEAEGFMKAQKDIDETMEELSLAFIRFTDNAKMVIV
ncbi:hypothetical protein MKW98_014238 [Papaver atlanticum]|uniref:Uncharacterized protein n=1 Tax=Papaver atlanticum TaxID=357466 RepID=A0AAD4T9U1_9MAGN|nr:hypothetical protein MKW98_014238 [Papaver atlanticum]